MAVNFQASVPKLKGRENYEEWAFGVQNVLILDGLWGCVEGTESDADKCAKAKARIVLTIDSALFSHIRDELTPKNVWDKLKSMFSDSGQTRKINLLRSLISTKMENCESMGDYVNKVVETSQRLKSTGFAIDDVWIGSLLLAGLPEKYSPMIMAIEHSGIAITADAIKTKLLDMEVEPQRHGVAFAGGENKGKYFEKKKHKGVKCYACKEFGHFKSQCPKLAGEETKSEQKKKKSHAFSAVFLSGQFLKTDWYVDSGASVHLCVNNEWMENISPDCELKEIIVANDTKVPVKCMGDVSLTTKCVNGNFQISVKNVVCVPELATNLLSVAQLIKNGNTVKFDTKGCQIYNKQEELVATADLIQNVYRLNIDRSACCLLTSGETWHRRFGHINSADLNKMKKAVDGLDFKGEVQCSKKNCKICCEGKQHRLPFPREGTRAKEVLEVVHADLCGPMEEVSIGGSRYFALFEDDATRMTFVYFLQSKSEVIDKFLEFKNLVENQMSRKIKHFRSDNGGEYCSKKFEYIFRKYGIIHQKTNSYTPEQNGMSERMNRTLVEKARCLMFDAGLGKEFWAEAINTAVYLRNRSLAAGLGDKTPYEMWHHRKPNVKHLRVFGSKVMVHIPKAKRTKWDKKSEEMILVGYSEVTKGYRVYSPDSHEISISRDVEVMEEVQIVITSETSPEVGDKSQETSENDYESTHEEEFDNFLPDQSSDSDYVVERDEPTVDTVRRSMREHKPKSFDDYVTFLSGISQKSPNKVRLDEDPTTVSDALSRPDSDMWKKAMAEEFISFDENEAWDVVDRPENGSVVDCKWVFKRKSESDGSVRYRARLVARGFTQIPGVDFDETFSPVVRHSILRLLFAISVKYDLEITHLDVATAFLNGHLDKEVFMNKPEGLEIGENKVLKLKKAIYGLKQSSRQWNLRVDQVLSKLGYKKSKFEPCLYTKKNGSSLTIVALYVDDFFIFSNCQKETSFLKEKLGSEFKVKDLGQAKQILGVRIQYSKDGSILLDQEVYIDQILRKFNMSECKSVSTPIDMSIDYESVEGTKCTDQNIPYQKLIGSLMYLAVLTRPDICFSVSFLSQYNTCFTDVHWKGGKRVLRYLQATKNYKLKFSKDNCELEGFADADWASNKKDRRSYTGFVFKLSGAAISWESSKQKTVALSSTEAEYMALSEASKEAIYLKNVYCDILDIDNNLCVTIFNDNQSAQKLSINPIVHKRSKHIDVRHHFIREAISNGLVSLKYLATNDMIADILTKGLGSVKHNTFVKQLGLTDNF